MMRFTFKLNLKFPDFKFCEKIIINHRCLMYKFPGIIVAPLIKLN